MSEEQELTMFTIGGSEKTREIVDAISSFFEEKNGERVIGKLRFEVGETEEDDRMTAYLGAHNGPELDLRKRGIAHSDPRAQKVMEVVSRYSEEELAEALGDRFAWHTEAFSFDSGPEGDIYEYSCGN